MRVAELPVAGGVVLLPTAAGEDEHAGSGVANA